MAKETVSLFFHKKELASQRQIIGDLRARLQRLQQDHDRLLEQNAKMRNRLEVMGVWEDF